MYMYMHVCIYINIRAGAHVAVSLSLSTHTHTLRVGAHVASTVGIGSLISSAMCEICTCSDARVGFRVEGLGLRVRVEASHRSVETLSDHGMSVTKSVQCLFIQIQ